MWPSEYGAKEIRHAASTFLHRVRLMSMTFEVIEGYRANVFSTGIQSTGPLRNQVHDLAFPPVVSTFYSRASSALFRTNGSVPGK